MDTQRLRNVGTYLADRRLLIHPQQTVQTLLQHIQKNVVEHSNPIDLLVNEYNNDQLRLLNSNLDDYLDCQ